MAFVVFTAALFFNVNAAAFSIHDSKRKLNLQVAYISTIAAYTHYEMAEGRDWYVNTFGPSGEVVAFRRVLHLTLVPIRPRRRGERRSLRTFPRRVSPPIPRFQSRHTSTPFNSI